MCSPLLSQPFGSVGDDIPILAQHFLRLHAEEQGIKPKELTKPAIECLQQHDWPGNIRELRNLVERLLIMVSHTVIDRPDVETFLQGRSASAHHPQTVEGFFSSLRDARNAFEREYITTKLRENSWNVSKTADDLKIERSHLHRKIKLLNVELHSDN